METHIINLWFYEIDIYILGHLTTRKINGKVLLLALLFFWAFGVMV